MLKQIHIVNYKSIEKAVVDLEPLTILVGPNGAGKSNIIDAIRFVADCLDVGPGQALRRRGGFAVVGHVPHHQHLENDEHGDVWGRHIGFRLTLQLPEEVSADYSFELEWRGLDHFVVASERCEVRGTSSAPAAFEARDGCFTRPVEGVRSQLKPDRLALSIVSAVEEFRAVYDFLSQMRHYTVEPDVMRALQDPEPGTTLKDDGSNAASVLRRIEGSRGYERMGGLLDLLLDDAPVEVHAMSIGPKETIEFIERGNGGQGRSLPAHSMSDGMLRFLGVLLAVYQKTPPSLIAVEEPESHVHPAAAEILFSALEEGTMQSQIVIATHSPEILDLKSLKEDQIRIVEMVSGKTIISAIGPQTKGIIRDRLFTAGELLSSNELRREDGVLDSREPELDIFKTEPAS